jgi:hypothetical protein
MEMAPALEFVAVVLVSLMFPLWPSAPLSGR